MKKDANASLRAAIRHIMENVLSEDAPEAGRVDSSIMGEQIKAAVGDAF